MSKKFCHNAPYNFCFFPSFRSYNNPEFRLFGKLRILKFSKSKRCRSSHRRCSIKIDVLKNFANFTGKHLCQSLFFNKVAGLKIVAQVFSCEVCRNFPNTFFAENLRKTTSEYGSFNWEFSFFWVFHKRNSEDWYLSIEQDVWLLMLFPINWPNFIVWLLLLLATCGNICVVVVCYPVCNIITF